MRAWKAGPMIVAAAMVCFACGGGGSSACGTLGEPTSGCAYDLHVTGDPESCGLSPNEPGPALVCAELCKRSVEECHVVLTSASARYPYILTCSVTGCGS